MSWSASRRAVIAGLSAYLATLTTSMPLGQAKTPPHDPLCQISEILADAKFAKPFIERWRAAQRAQDREDRILDGFFFQLRQRLGRRVAMRHSAELAYVVQGLIKDDFETGRIERVDGWIFAQSEIALAIMAADIDKRPC